MVAALRALVHVGLQCRQQVCGSLPQHVGPTLLLCSAQVLALRALTGMAAVLAQRVSGLSSLDADLAALEAGDLPPDQRAATMLVANKKRVLNGAAQALAAALKVRPLLRKCVTEVVSANECRAIMLTANKKHELEAARTCAAAAMKASPNCFGSTVSNPVRVRWLKS